MEILSESWSAARLEHFILRHLDRVLGGESALLVVLQDVVVAVVVVLPQRVKLVLHKSIAKVLHLHVLLSERLVLVLLFCAHLAETATALACRSHFKYLF